MYLLIKFGLAAAPIAFVPLLLRRGVSFYPALGVDCACTVTGYAVMSLVLHRFSVKV